MFLKLSDITKWCRKQEYWHFKEIENSGGRQLVYEKNGDIGQVFYFRVSVCITFWKCISQTSRTPIDSRTVGIV